MIGAEVGPYRVLSKLGIGGMATVYLAEVCSLVENAPDAIAGQRVALKLVHPHLLASRSVVDRFLREAEAGTRVKHENVVRTFDVGETTLGGEPCHYLSMEYVEGRTLRALLTSLGVVPEALIREIAVQVADGLSAIHAAGIVHRDLKPANVLVTDDHRIRVMDLGIARLADASVALTRDGQFAGSIRYAAPEQVRGHDVGPTADFYSLGVLLHELATGTNPFPGDDPMKLLHARLTAVPPRADRINPDLSPFVVEVLATLMQVDPLDRFESAAMLRDTLIEAERSTWWAEREAAVLLVQRPRPKVQVRRETKLHARTGELALLRSAWDRAARGEGNTFMLEGEPGVGKTRLVDAFLESVRESDAHVLYGSFPPAGGVDGLSAAITDHFGAAGLEGQLRPYLTITPALVPGFAALLRKEPVPAGAESLAGDAVHAVFVHLARALAQERPLIWVADDLHFASVDLRGVLRSLAGALDGHRILLVLVTRPGLPEGELAHFSRLSNFVRAPLGRLKQYAVIQLLREAFKSDALAEKLGTKIAAKSDGVPYFVFEMIRGLEEHGFLERRPGGRYVEASPIDEIRVPSAIRDLIEARIEDLSDGDRNLLDMAAVQGYEFDPALVAAMLELRRVDVLQRLSAMERRVGVVQADGALYRFDHHQIQELLYTDLAETLREEYHALLAAAYAREENITPERAPQLSGESALYLARHALLGCRPGDALPYLASALDHLARVYRSDPGIDLADRALSVIGLLDQTRRVDVLLRKADWLRIQGRAAEEGDTLDEALSLCDAGEDPYLRARARVAFGQHLYTVANYQRAQDVLQEAISIALEAEDRQLEAEATGTLGGVFHRLGHYAEARSLHERGLTLTRETGDRRGQATALGRLGDVFLAMGHYEQARALHGRFLDMARELSDWPAEVRALGSLGTTMAAVARLAEARGLHEECLRIATQIGDREGEALALANLGRTHALLGDLRTASAHLQKSRALCKQIGRRSVESVALFGLAQSLESLGETDEAERLFHEALELQRETGQLPGVAQTLVALGGLLARQGRTAEAVQFVQEAIVLAWELDASVDSVLATMHVTLLLGGDPADAEAIFAANDGRLEHRAKMEARFLLWRATRLRHHLDDAHALLVELRAHAPDEFRGTIVDNVPLHHEIDAMWRRQRRRDASVEPPTAPMDDALLDPLTNPASQIVGDPESVASLPQVPPPPKSVPLMPPTEDLDHLTASGGIEALGDIEDLDEESEDLDVTA